MSSENEQKSNQEEIGVLAGLLDFHSDRAEAQASFLIACVFGLFTLLAIVQSIQNEGLIFLSTVLYIMLTLVGYHCLQRFRFYAEMADAYKRSLERYVECLSDREVREHPRIFKWAKRNDKWEKMPLRDFHERLSKKYGGIPERFKTPRFMNLSAVAIFGLPFLIVYLPRLYVFLLRVIFKTESHNIGYSHNRETIYIKNASKKIHTTDMIARFERVILRNIN